MLNISIELLRANHHRYHVHGHHTSCTHLSIKFHGKMINQTICYQFFNRIASKFKSIDLKIVYELHFKWIPMRKQNMINALIYLEIFREPWKQTMCQCTWNVCNWKLLCTHQTTNLYLKKKNLFYFRSPVAFSCGILIHSEWQVVTLPTQINLLWLIKLIFKMALIFGASNNCILQTCQKYTNLKLTSIVCL